jgi:hypothetical protein
VTYQALVLVPVPRSGSELVERARQELMRQFDGLAVVENSGDRLVLRFGIWSLRVVFTDAAHVLEETRELVELCGSDRPDVPVLRALGARFELGTDEDPEMIHFNDYVLACEALERIDQAVAIDMAEPNFMSGKLLSHVAG